MTQVFRDLVETFGKGWEQGDAEQMVSVFTSDAVFLDSPFSTRELGQPAIRTYWAHVPRNQSDVKFKAGEIFSAGSWFAAEYRCTFRRRRTGQWADVRGAMFCETRDGKISEMRMYWHRE